jgi:hypothetical protein
MVKLINDVPRQARESSSAPRPTQPTAPSTEFFSNTKTKIKAEYIIIIYPTNKLHDLIKKLHDQFLPFSFISDEVFSYLQRNTPILITRRKREKETHHPS